MSEDPTRTFLPVLSEKDSPGYSLAQQALFVLFFVNVIWALVVVGIVWMLH